MLIQDIDNAGVMFSSLDLNITEGEKANYSIVLTSRPLGDVLVTIREEVVLTKNNSNSIFAPDSSMFNVSASEYPLVATTFDYSLLTQVVVNKYSVWFSPDDWNIPVTFEVTAIFDGFDERFFFNDKQLVFLHHNIISLDNNYYGPRDSIVVKITEVDAAYINISVTPLPPVEHNDQTPNFSMSPSENVSVLKNATENRTLSISATPDPNGIEVPTAKELARAAENPPKGSSSQVILVENGTDRLYNVALGSSPFARVIVEIRNNCTYIPVWGPDKGVVKPRLLMNGTRQLVRYLVFERHNWQQVRTFRLSVSEDEQFEGTDGAGIVRYFV